MNNFNFNFNLNFKKVGASQIVAFLFLLNEKMNRSQVAKIGDKILVINPIRFSKTL